MSRTLRSLGAMACVWSLPLVVMAQAAGGVPAGGLGGRELILIVAITLLMAGVSRLPGFTREEACSGGGASSSRAYIDSLLGLAQRPVSAAEPTRSGTGPGRLDRVRRSDQDAHDNDQRRGREVRAGAGESQAGVEAYTPGKSITVLRSDGSRVNYSITSRSRVPEDVKPSRSFPSIRANTSCRPSRSASRSERPELEARWGPGGRSPGLLCCFTARPNEPG